MTPSADRIAAIIRGMANAPRAGELFAVGRVMTCGEPVLWEETISYEFGRLQQFSRTRSLADEGGAAIGAWAAPADEALAKALAQAMVQVDFCNCVSDTDLMPGMEVINWSIVTREGTWDVLAVAGSPLALRLAPLDQELRRLANALEDANRGSTLRLVLQAQAAEPGVRVRVSLVNDAHRPCILENPFLGPGEFDYLRLELSPLPVEQPGVTDIGAVFEPLQLELMSNPPPDPWGDTYITLLPGQPLVLPLTPLIGAPAGAQVPHGDYLLRAVYSHYGLLPHIASIPVIRGRAFSNELEFSL